MQFIRGNLALKEHLNIGKRVFLFEIEGGGLVKFVSEMEFYDADYFETPDINGTNRIGIKFFLKRIGVSIPVNPDQFTLLPLNQDPHKILELNLPTVTERSGLITSRVGQGAYRKRIIHRWEYKCAVTNFNKLDILIASHIVPWSKATNQERLDVNNGLLLSPTYDALFDMHPITFDNNGKIILSDKIEFSAYQKIGITGKEKIDGLSEYNHHYLKMHQEMMK
jgi:predicted restriction endonuclease